jgi:pimeloyl-ACP methyl ester carboxylesterase
VKSILANIPKKCGRMMTVQDTPELIREKIPSLKKKFGYFNVQLQTYLAENFNPMKPTIIFIHGHGSSFIKLPYKRRSSLRTLIKFRRNISRISPMKTESGRGSWMRFGKPLWKKGYNVFGIDMRNHGGSDIALPFAFGNIEKWDVRTGIEHIRKISSAPIFLHGSSLGTTHSILALGTFQDLPISGLIIESAPAAFNTELFKVWISRVSSCIKYIPKCVFLPIVFWNKLLLLLFSGVCWKNPKNSKKCSM